MFRDMPQLGGVALAPIPASMLPSSMAVTQVGFGEYGEEETDLGTISNVRFDRADSFTLASSGGAPSGYVFKDGSKGLVYVDAANSGGAFEVPEGALVRIDGGDAMRVVAVNVRASLDGSAHHYEIEVA